MSATESVSAAATDRSGVSVVIPFRNEEQGLAEMVRAQVRTLQEARCAFEIILVDDGSSDGSARVAESILRELPSVRLQKHVVNQGIAGGLLTGARAAVFDSVLLIPVDNPLDRETVLTFLRAGQEADVVAGWRSGRPDYGAFRRYLSNIYVRAANSLLGLSLKDPTWICLYRRSIFEGFHQRFTRIAGLPELLQHAASRGARFSEIPCAARPRTVGCSTGARPLVVLKTGLQTLALGAIVLPSRLRSSVARSFGGALKEKQLR